jgi:hypothetical protein
MNELTADQIRVRRFIMTIKGSAPSLMTHIFTQGGCYSFYLALKTTFPSAVAYWDANRDHVITKIYGLHWDIYCEVDEDEIGEKMNKEEHKTASLFRFDELYFITRHVRKYMDGEKD